MSNVRFNRINSSSQINNYPVADGSLWVTGDGKMYADYDDNRLPVGGTPDNTMSDSSTNTVQNNTIKAYVDEKTNINILTATLSDNYALQNTSSYEILPLTQYIKIGNKLSVNSSGGIVIGAGINYIKVSSNVSYNTVASANAKWNTIFKNTSAIYPCPTYANNRVTIGNNGGLISVTQGDVIYLKVQGSATDVIRGGTSNKYTCLTVEVVS